MSRRRPEKILDHQEAVVRGTCPVGIIEGAPEGRGQIGWVTRRNGSGVEQVWWMRCPWCREMIVIDPGRINMRAGRFEISRRVTCRHCETAFKVKGGEARKL